ncbi:hypothetical protein QTP70_006961 [Hemibagrus guttatus]|uniref:Paired domain-containing protein n=1 Tax=Hemibagrus guttatus TaxID=175788 RepID=A0AAE0QDP6_9TELE|nr:hypothetical protein QTP70_006961 [Hemibagrus guttatus]
MGGGSPIPPMLRPKIVEQYQKGVSQRKIAKSLKLSSSTVHNIIQRFRESGTISVRKGQGRKTILDARDLRALRRHCITYRNAAVMEITTWAQEYLQKTLSVNTIHRAIRRRRLKLYRSKKKPYLNMIQKRRRFLWAKAHLKWTVAKWKTVLWSDQSKFEVLFGKLGRHFIRTKEDKDNPSCYQRSVQKPASLMVWGCMSACVMGSLHIWKGTINAESLIQNLSRALPDSPGSSLAIVDRLCMICRERSYLIRDACARYRGHTCFTEMDRHNGHASFTEIDRGMANTRPEVRVTNLSAKTVNGDRKS